MLSSFEKYSRIKEYYKFSRLEIISLGVLSVVFGFLFSMNFPGETFRVISWLKYFFIASFIAAISFFIRISFQKISGLGKGYYAEFKVWWEGVVASIIIAFLSFGRLPLILAGGITSSFMVRQRLGEFQYGHSYEENSQIALTGLTANLLLATIFALFKLFYPESFFFSIGIKMNLIMALCFMLPFPQLEGLQIYFGSRFLYLLGWIVFILTSLLILSGTKIGLIIIIILASIISIIKTLWKA